MAYAPFATNPSPLAAQRLLAQPLVTPPVLARPLNPPALPGLSGLPTNASPVAIQRLQQLQQGTLGRPPAPMQVPIPANPAQQALRASLPRGFGTAIQNP